MKPRVLLLYEYSQVGLPHSSAYVRLLRPLSYPAVQERFFITAAPVYAGQAAEIVVIDRTWHPDLTLESAMRLVESLEQQDIKWLYHLDDDLLTAPTDAVTEAEKAAVAFFLRQANAVLVSTQPLAEQVQAHNRHVYVVPNALDERLLSPLTVTPPPFADRPLVMGYMGTRTHDHDLQMLLPALQAVGQEVQVPLALHIIGGAASASTWQALNALPFPVRAVQPPVEQYPHFIAWFTSSLPWDIALAPLTDTPFNRCKSDVKFLDYSALGLAGIYSDGLAYNSSVLHGVTGWLVQNKTAVWVEALHRLIADAALRRELGANARRHLYQERILAHRIQDWIAALESVLYG